MGKNLIASLVIAAITVGCAGIKQTVTNPTRGFSRIVISKYPVFYSDANGEVQAQISEKPYKQWDTVYVDLMSDVTWVSALNDAKVGTGRYERIVSKPPVWIAMIDVDQPECKEVHQMNGIITVHSSKSNEAWSRVIAWISENADMKIQISTEYSVETYNPTDATKRGRSATRQIIGDSVQIQLKTISKYGSYSLPNCSFYNKVKYNQ